jgi:hypothetical protein
MNPNLLAIIVSYYFSKFDKEGMENLGFKSDSEAFEKTAKILGVKRNYVKFRRDEFDSIHPWRKGWQRPMVTRIIKAIEALQDLDEPDLRDIVLKILHDEKYRNSEEVQQITSLFANTNTGNADVGKFVLRAPTGRAAEEFFIKHYSENKRPCDGNLIDCRDLGVGYDFKIETNEKNCFVEVKGLSDFSGGVLFTSKEWIVAKKEGDNYFLCIISNLCEQPNIAFIQNPANKLNPKRNIYTSIQISWSVTNNQLAEIM